MYTRRREPEHGGFPACQAAPHTEKHATRNISTRQQKQDKTRHDTTRHDTQCTHISLTTTLTHFTHTPHTTQTRMLGYVLVRQLFDLESVSAMKKKVNAWIYAPRATDHNPARVILDKFWKSVIFAFSCGHNNVKIISLIFFNHRNCFGIN